MNPYYALGWQMFIASFVILLMAKLTGNFNPLVTIPLKSWLSIGYLVVTGSLLAFIAFVYTIRHLPSALASLYAYINPIIAIIVGSFVFKEKLTMYILMGSLITLAGVYMVNQSLKKKN